MEIRLVVTTFGEFRVVTKDEWGNASIVAEDQSLEECLLRATRNLGVPLSMPVVRADQ